MVGEEGGSVTVGIGLGAHVSCEAAFRAWCDDCVAILHSKFTENRGDELFLVNHEEAGVSVARNAAT